MSLTAAGWTAIASLLIGDAVKTAFNNANAYLGVGDTATAFNSAQTDLAASSNKKRIGMDSTYPLRTANVITFRSTFATGDANWAWAENGIFNAGPTGGDMLTRAVETLITKTSAVSVVFTKTLTIQS